MGIVFYLAYRITVFDGQTKADRCMQAANFEETRRVAFILRHMLAMLATHTRTQQELGQKKRKTNKEKKRNERKENQNQILNRNRNTKRHKMAKLTNSGSVP